MVRNIKNKKGNLLSIITIMVVILVIGVVVVFGNVLTTRFYSVLDNKNVTTPEMEESEVKMINNFQLFDNAVLMVFVILTIILIVTSFLIPTHPIFVVINIFGIFLLVFGGMIMNNVYGEIMSADPQLESTAQGYEKITFLISYLPYIAAILVAIFSIVMYTRSNGGGAY